MAFNQAYDFSHEEWSELPVLTPCVTPGYLHSQLLHSSFRKQASLAKGVFHLLLLLTLAFGVVQGCRAVGTGLFKWMVLTEQRPVAMSYLQKVQQNHQSLKQDIHKYSSHAGMEELARNQLEFVGPGEILVRLY